MASVLLSRRINPTTAPLLHRAATRSCRLASSKAADPSRPISVPGEKLLEFFSEEFEVGSQKTRIETGLLARFANGAAVFNVGDTHVLSAVACRQADATHDFLPLTVEYQEKQYAQGVIPTTFLRREGAPRERELLCGRLIDRPIRPLFPKGFYHDVQVTVNVLASDRIQDPDVMAVNATSAALMLSDIPWDGPIGVVRLGRVEGRFVINPSMDELSRSDLNLVYACTRDRTLMIDGQAREITENDLTAGLHVAHLEAARYIEPQIRLAERAGKRKKDYTLSMFTQRTLEKVEGMTGGPIEDVFTDPKYGKFDRGEALDKITQNAKAILEEECDEESLKFLPKVVDTVRKKVVRRRIIEKGLRVDGRQLDEVRGLQGMHGVYSALHGSSLFRRGETQVFCTVTLGTPGDAQRLDSLVGPPTKRFMLHYSFPPFSINEVGKRVGPNRREVGHGTLAEKALLAVLPPEDDFPYTVRVNSEVMASDGSTSMASVCGGSMALMDAGIPVREHVAGISVGLISDTDPSTGSIRDYRILTDLLGLEDHLGDMDFKVAGTRKGISAIQLDVKPAGIPLGIICESLDHARRGRIQILDYMDQVISRPRTQNDLTGPRLATLKYSNESIRRLIGPLGLKKRIEQETGARIFVGDESLSIIAKDQDIMDKVLEKVDFVIGRDIEVGGVYKGIITSIKEYGAFVEFSGGRHGLLHISELSHGLVSKVSDVVSVGEQVSVMCSGMDVRGNIKLSLKALLPRPEPEADPKITPISSKEPLEVCASVDGANADITAYESESCRSDASDDTPEVLIRSSDECDDPDITFEKGSLNSAGENVEPSCGSSGTSPMGHSGRVAHMFSDLFSSKRFSAANGKSRTMEPALDACESKHSLLGGTKQDGSMGIATTAPSSCVKLGDRYTAKVHRIHLHGMVLDLGDGLLGMYKFQENIKRNFTIGTALEVKCTSFSSKGIPIMTLSED